MKLTSEKMSIEAAGELMEMRCRGMIAAMISSRFQEPTPEQWAFLRGEKEISIRAIAEIAHDLDFIVDFNFGPIGAHEETPDET